MKQPQKKDKVKPLSVEMYRKLIEGEAIRLLNENTVESAVKLVRENQ